MGCLKIKIWKETDRLQAEPLLLLAPLFLKSVYGAKRDRALEGETLILPGLRDFPFDGLGVSKL